MATLSAPSTPLSPLLLPLFYTDFLPFVLFMFKVRYVQFFGSSFVYYKAAADFPVCHLFSFLLFRCFQFALLLFAVCRFDMFIQGTRIGYIDHLIESICYIYIYVYIFTQTCILSWSFAMGKTLLIIERNAKLKVNGQVGRKIDIEIDEQIYSQIDI